MARPADGRRYYGLDALRGVMMMLGIVLHGAIFYVAHPPVPIPVDAQTSVVFDVTVYFIHSFRMPLFFVLAGFFTSLLVEKYGVRGSYVNRAKRILAPFALGMLVIVPPTAYFMVCALVSAYSGERVLVTELSQLEVIDLEALAEAGLRQEPSPAHLWFLYYLLYFYLAIPLLKSMAGWLTSSAWDAHLIRLVRSPLLMPALGLLTAATLWPYRGALVFEGFQFFTPHLPSLIYYGSFFFLGYLFHAYRQILEVFTHYLAEWWIAAALLFPAALAASWLDMQGGGRTGATHLLAVVAHGLCTWALIYAFTGTFLKYTDHDSPWSLYISQSSYWVYLLHMPVVSGFGWYLMGFDLPAGVKFALAASATTVICFTSYHYLVRRSWVSVLLNGKRFDLGWPWAAAASMPPAPSAPGS